MHVLIIPSWFDPKAPYRVSPFIFEQALSLRSSNMVVGVLHVGFSGWGMSYTCREVDGISIASVSLPWILRRTRQLSLNLLSIFYEILYQVYCRHYGVPDILHAHSMYAGGICTARLASWHKRPFVITEHFSGFALGKLRQWQLKLIRISASSSARMFFVSETLRQDFETHIPVTNGRVLANNYSDILSEEIVPFSAQNSRSYFCIVARLDGNKNVAMCLRAFAMLHASDQELHIVGSGVERPRLEQLARELRINERVKFHGARSRRDTFAIIKGASALIICSAYETFGMTVLEAAMLRTPVICTRCCGPEEILGKNFGVLIERDDIKGLAKAMHEAVTERAKFRCDEAFLIVSSNYNPTKIASQLKAEYIKVLSEYARR
jgi:glycosyltransferase involved in cell wall biosynthesis